MVGLKLFSEMYSTHNIERNGYIERYLFRHCLIRIMPLPLVCNFCDDFPFLDCSIIFHLSVCLYILLLLLVGRSLKSYF
jgi:hypothetical protein